MKTKTKELFSRIKKTIYMPQMLLLPGQLAFFLVLAIIPTMTLITYGASVLNLSTDFLYDFLQKAFSSEIAGLLLSSSAVNNDIATTSPLLYNPNACLAAAFSSSVTNSRK